MLSIKKRIQEALKYSLNYMRVHFGATYIGIDKNVLLYKYVIKTESQPRA